MLSSIPEDERSDCWWLVQRDGTPVRGDRGGGVVLLMVFPFTRPLGATLRALGLSPVVDVLDMMLARARKHLSRFVPDGPAVRRFP